MRGVKILKQRLFLVTGKGGVGKSTVAMALARKLAGQGQKTLLAELGEYSYFELAMGYRSTYEPAQISENLDFSLWNGESCLREYVRHLVPVRAVADLFFDNKVMRSFVRAAPGLKELAVLGKLTSGIRNWGPKFDYENVVVDAYSSGHFMALLNAPKGLGELIESGPMGEQSRSIFKALSNPAYTQYIIVTLPEELPVAEAIELHTNIKELTGAEPKVFLNKFYDFQHPDMKSTDYPLAKYLDNLSQRSQESRTKLLHQIKSVDTLPFVKEVSQSQLIATVSEQFQGEL